MKILITGGAGFIGSALIRHIIAHTDHSVLNVDKLTYAGNLESLGAAARDQRHTFAHEDIRDRAALDRLFAEYQPDAVMHLAAESHVDRSIHAPDDFIQTNLVGTYQLLEAARTYWSTLPADRQKTFRFHHVSTDEVYGDLSDSSPPFSEDSPYAPSSPYSASKAGSDHLVRAWQRTFGLPILVTNCSNNYGPYQFPEKLIPVIIFNAVEGKRLPVYGRGENSRDWLYVDDHVRALLLVLERGQVGETYLIGGRSERRNIDVVHDICELLEECAPRLGYPKPAQVGNYCDLVTFVTDRPGHDLRYAINPQKIESELGWRAQESFVSGLRKTIEWYLTNPQWVDQVRSGEYRHWIEKHYGESAE